MYILKNAYLSIIRNKGRNILIGIIILVISCASAVTLAIKTSASKIINSYEEKNEITGSIEVNRDNVMKNFDPSKENRDSSKKEMIEEFNNLESLSISDIENYANSEYVKNYYYTLSTNLNSTNIEATSMSLPNDNQTDNEKNRNNMPMDNIKDDLGKNETQGDFSLVGYSSYEAMQEFISGAYSITEGKISSNFEDATCVINKELATLNNLSVSDKITLVDPNDETKTFEVTITGIFTENEDTNSDNKMNMFSKSSNMIITNANFVKGITESDENLNLKVTPTFILKDKASIEKFEVELTEKGLNDNLKLTTNLEEVESATKSISNISTFSTTFLIITLIIGATILFVLNMINVRERKYEIGVLRTIGMKNRKRIDECIKYGILDTLIVTLTITILFEILAKPLSSLFSLTNTTSTELVKVCTLALRIASIGYIFMGFSVAIQGVLQALRYALAPLIISFLRLVIFVFPIAYLFTLSTSVLTNIWWVFPIAEFLTAIISCFILKHCYNEKVAKIA